MPLLQLWCNHCHLAALPFLGAAGEHFYSHSETSAKVRTVTAFQVKYENQKACLGLTSELTQG